MKCLLVLCLFLFGCAAKQVKCRLVAVDEHYKILQSPPPAPWHVGMDQCKVKFDVVWMLGDESIAVEVKGPKPQRDSLWNWFIKKHPEAQDDGSQKI